MSAAEVCAIQDAILVQALEEFGGGTVAFGHVAVGAAGDQVAVPVLAEAGARHDVVNHALMRQQAAEAVEATVAVAAEDGRAAVSRRPEVERIEAAAVRQAIADAAGDFMRQFDGDTQAVVAAVEDGDDAFGSQAAQADAHRAAGEQRAAAQQARGHADDAAPRETALADEVEVDDAVGGPQRKGWREVVFDVGPESGGGDAVPVHWFFVRG